MPHLRVPIRVTWAVLATLIVSVPNVAGAAPGAAPEEQQFVVGFRIPPRNLRAGDRFLGARVERVDNVLHFARVSTRNPSAFRSQANSDSRVRFVEPDPELQLIDYTPNDPQLASQYGPQHVRAPEAWDTTLGDADASVCIVDTGVRYTHEEIAGTRWLGGHDFFNGDADPNDDNGHGTHVASTAAGSIDNGKGIAGIANVGIRGVKVLSAAGSGAWSTVASGIRWCADNGGPRVVISMSLGGGHATVLEDAVLYAAAKGALLVAAAGNSGPCSNCVGYPAAYPEVIAVTCTTSTKTQCSFSSDGAESELTAPGQSIVAAWHTGDTAYNTISGTSMSTPHVAGVAALVWSHETAWSAGELRKLLRDNAQDLGSAGWDELYGYGLVDARATLDAAGGPPPPPPPPETTLYLENFDDGSANGWTLTGMWRVTSGCTTAASLPNHLVYNKASDCKYSNGSSRTTGTATFDVDLSDSTVATLKLKHRWVTELYAGGAYDIRRVQVSMDGGAGWSTLRQWDTRNANQTSWKDLAIDIDQYAGRPIKLRFFFDTVDGISNGFAGWFLDNVEVTGDLPVGNQPPVADAGPDQTVSDHDGTGTETVTLDGSGSTDPDGTIVSYEWREGGSLLATGATPSVAFGVGTHTVTLTVTDDDGAPASNDMVITVNANQGPTASFTTSTSGLTVNVDGSASGDPDGSITGYSWDWGDGSPAGSGATATHTYAASGTYTVALTVTDDGGATDTASRQVTVVANQPPVADAGPDQTVSDHDGTGTETVTLDGSGSTDPDGTIASYEWREGADSIATGANPSVGFAAGSHTVTLTVTDDDGETGSDDVLVIVNPNQAPTASFTESTSGLAVNVDGSASTDPDGSIASYSWDWGDASPAGSGVTANHTYAEDGTYTVALTVTDDGGETDQVSKQVTVSSVMTIVSQNFDSGPPPGWTLTGMWHVSSVCATAPSTPNYLAYNKDSDCRYSNGSSRTTGTATFDANLTGTAQARLTFTHRWQTEVYSGGAYDIRRVQVSTNGGSTWTTLQQWDSRNPNQPSWVPASYDLTPYAGRSVKLRFFFDTVDGISNVHPGWFIDDVRVTGS